VRRTEAFSRALIDAQLGEAGWKVTDGVSVRFEDTLGDGTRADYVLCDRHGRALAVVEAKRSSVNAADAAEQGRRYAELLDVPFVFLANGVEVRFWDWRNEAHPRPVATFYSQADLERRIASATLRRDPLAVPIDRRVASRDYQHACIDALCRGIGYGRRSLLVEMATGTGKTRTAAAFIKRLFEANAVTRVLFLVDRITLAHQTADEFADHLPDLPSYVLRAGRRFDDAKRVTIATLQSMVNIYRDYSSGYFDLVITDECHRSIYGQWSGVLKHFDGIQLGLTATPCVADESNQGDDEKLFVRDTLRFFGVDRPTFSYGIRQAIEDGYLVPYQIYKAKTVKTASEGGFEVKKNELDWTAMDAATRAELEAAFNSNDTLVVDPNALERRFTIPERNRAIVREYREVMRDGYLDAKGIQRKPVPGKTVVFAVTKRHAETLARMFDEAFAEEKPHSSVRYADYVVSDTGGDDTTDGMTRIRRFKKEKFPQILVSVNMLDTGFDFPELQNLVFARYTRSAILYRQMRGRGARKAPGKALFSMFDFVGITDLLEDNDDLVQGGLVRIAEPRPRPQPRRLLALDIDDQIDPSTRAWVTMDAEGNLIQPDAVEARAQTLGARFEAWLLQHEAHMDAEQRRWLALVGSTLRANADALEEFTPDHLDAFQTFIMLGGQARARQVFGGERKLEQLLSDASLAVFSPPETGAGHVGDDALHAPLH
jgi:type I restriction enzyme R subunit